MIKLVAIDLDGTLFDSNSKIPEENIRAIHFMSENGIYPVISTGRPLKGIPEELNELPFAYAITANGSAIYDWKTGKCIYENTLDRETTLEILQFLNDKFIHLDCFIEGKGLSTYRSLEVGEHLPIPPALKHYVLYTRERVENLTDYILENDKYVQKMTLNFVPKENDPDSFIDRDEIKAYFEAHPNIDSCCGGYNNLEATKTGVNKGAALHMLAKQLGLKVEETMAIGDTENDVSIIEAAGIGVAMENAIPEIKELANHITSSNDEAGVAQAVWNFCLK